MKRRTQRGAATLLVALILLGAMLLVLLGANRSLLLELRMSANQVDAGAAFEAAEAGIEWAAAMLDAPEPLGADCRANDGGADSFRARHLRFVGAAIVPQAIAPACVATPTGWSCHGPPAGAATLPDTDGAGFTLQFQAGARAGTVQLVATGRGPNRSTSAQHRVVFALQPALLVPPPTALTQRTPAQTTDAFFAERFGLSKAAWQAQAGVTRVDCRGDCSEALRAALAASGERPLLWIDGEALLQGPLTLGTAERPVVIAASGPVRLHGAVTLHGVLYGSTIDWSGVTTPLRGALLSEGTAGGDGTLALAHDAALLEILRSATGTLQRVPGSWRDH